MQEIWLPTTENIKEPRVNIFLSKEAQTTNGKLMVIICGTGDVK
jgi:hypothetical protein